jgi:hypothetical protein
MIGSDLDYELFELTNKFRSNPSAFVDFIQRKFEVETVEYQKNYLGALLNNMDAYQVRNMPRRNPMKWTEGLALAAREKCVHGQDP